MCDIGFQEMDKVGNGPAGRHHPRCAGASPVGAWGRAAGSALDLLKRSLVKEWPDGHQTNSPLERPRVVNAGGHAVYHTIEFADSFVIDLEISRKHPLERVLINT